jgi:hypothetical protein
VVGRGRGRGWSRVVGGGRVVVMATREIAFLGRSPLHMMVGPEDKRNSRIEWSSVAGGVLAVVSFKKDISGLTVP